MKRKIGALQDDLIIPGVLVVAGYFLVAKPLLDMLGINDTDQKVVDSIDGLSPKENPFSYQFAFSSYSQNPLKYGSAYYQNLKSTYDDGVINPNGDLAYTAELVNNAFGFWHNGRIDDLAAVFNNVINQQAVSDIAAYLYFNYNKDMWYWLKNGYQFLPGLRNGVPYNKLAEFVNHILALPQQ